MTICGDTPQTVCSVPLRHVRSNRPRVVSGASFPGGNGLIACGLSPVAAMR